MTHRNPRRRRNELPKPHRIRLPLPRSTPTAEPSSPSPPNPRFFLSPSSAPHSGKPAGIRKQPQDERHAGISFIRRASSKTTKPTAARTVHMRRDFASVNNRRRNLAVHAIRSPATAQQTSAALPPSRRYPRKVRSLFLQDLAKGFARRRHQTASMPAHIPNALTRR